MGCNKTAMTCSQRRWICALTTVPSRGRSERREGNHSLYGTLCSLVSLFLSWSLSSPGARQHSGQETGTPAVSVFCSHCQRTNQACLSHPYNTHTHTWLDTTSGPPAMCVTAWYSGCVCGVCKGVQWKKSLFVISSGLSSFLKVYSWYRLSGSNRVLALDLEKQSID